MGAAHAARLARPRLATGGLALVAVAIMLPGIASASNRPSASVRFGPIGSLLVTMPNPAPAVDSFDGHSVAISGNVAVVGTSQDSSTGAAFVYLKKSSGWPTTPKVTLQDPAATAFDGFGSSVAVSGKTIVVGAYGGPAGDGVAYVYEKGVSGWPTAPTVTLDDPDSTGGDIFGYAVAVSGSAIVVGAPGTESNAGAEYIYIASGSAWPSTPTVIAPNPAPKISDGFGISVAIAGSEVVVGAAGTNAFPGMAWIEYKSASGRPTNFIRSLYDPAATAGDFFGTSVAVHGSTVVIGSESSAAYIYTKGTGGWPSTSTSTLPDPPGGFPEDNFGITVAVSGTRIVVGDNAAGPTGGGQAYIYTPIDSTWVTEPVATLTDPGGDGSDEFGRSVAVSDGTAIVGAPGTNTAQGAAYLYST